MESNEIKKAFLDSYEILNDKKVNNANFDKTIQGTIIDCKDPSVGRYLVRYQDSTIEAYSVSPSVDYPKGNLVYISVPQGNMKNQKTILGSAKQLGTNYIEELIQEDTFDATKNLLQTDLEISLSSYKSEDTILSSEDISFTEGLEGEIRNANFLKIKGKVRTNLANQQKRDGHYGLKITLIVRNNATGVEEEQDYYFDSNSFAGNPYNYETAITQEVSHPLDGVNFVRVKSISKFVQGFPLQEEGKEPDIFLSNISINGSYKLSDTEKATIGIVLEAPYGYTFAGNSEESGSTVRPIKANVRAKGKLVDLDRQNVEIYWFKADPRITPTHEDYLKYGGSGWKCINPEKLSNSSIEISMDMVQYNRENLFKCVAVYDNKTFSKQFTIYNYDAKYEVSIESTEGVNFAYSTGHPNLICHVLKNGKELNQGIRYQWKSVNSQNVNEDLNDTDTSQYQEKLKEIEQIELIVNKDEEVYWNQQIKTKKKVVNEQEEEIEINLFWYDNLKVPTIKENIGTYENSDLTWQQRYDELKDFTSNFEKSQRVKGNTIYNLNLYKIIDYTTFYCSCFIGDELIGIAKIVIYNQAAALAGYNLVINNGDQVFLYDQNGMSLQSAAIDQPYNISDLSYTLIYNGVPIDEQQLAFAIPTWKIPLKNTMIEMGEQEASGDYLYKKGSTLTFDVSNKYNVSNSNNDIYLTLQYNDQTFTTKTNFTFNKQGGIGTNGTKYQFKITPEKDVLYFNNNGEYINDNDNTIIVTPHIWYNGVQKDKDDFNVSWDILLDRTISGHWSNLAQIDPSSKKAILEDQGIFEIQKMKDKDSHQDNNLNNIIKATASINNLNYYATVPISTVFYHIKHEDEKINIEIPDDAGFKYVTYKNDGTNPSYNELKPFEVDIYKTIGSQKENISNKESEHFSYEWKVLPQGESGLEIINTDNNTAKIRPKDNFSKAGNQVTNAILIQIIKVEEIEKENSQTGEKEIKNIPFATIHIPIHMMLNRYENAALNDWDGNTIDINDNGYILTPQVGAGKKENNTFTGVLLGTERTSDGDKTGLLGYAAGVRSIFLDSTTGNAEFGKNEPGYGQIIIDVGNTQGAKIKSNDYQIPSSDQDRTDNDIDKPGMQIQFSGQPHIYFSSGNFMVDDKGKITARGGGSIAGWNINDKTLYSIDDEGNGVIINSDSGSKENSESENKAIQVWNKKINNENPIFSVNYKGQLYSEKGKIGGWAIESDKLHNTNIGMAPRDWVSGTFNDVDENGNTVQKNLYTGVFWAGQEADNKPDNRIIDDANKHVFLKRNFFVTQTGYLFARRGNIGGWEISSNKLSYPITVGGKTVDKVGLSAINAELIWALGSDNKTKIFSVNRDGYMYAKDGTIGNWRFGNNGLYSEGNGNISSYKNKNDEFPSLGDKGGIYVGADGIRLGNSFHVEPSGYLYALSGNIGNCEISSGGISSRNKAWTINSGGSAEFTDVKIGGKSVVELLGFSSGGSGSSNAGTYLGGGAAYSGGEGLRLNSGQITVTYNGKTYSLQGFVDALAEEVVTKKVTADFISGKLATLSSIWVKYLTVGYAIRLGGREEQFDEDDLHLIYENEGAISRLEQRVSALEQSKTP